MVQNWFEFFPRQLTAAAGVARRERERERERTARERVKGIVC